LNSGIPGQLGNIVRLWLKQTNKKMKGEREEGRKLSSLLKKVFIFMDWAGPFLLNLNQ
jgi:hypothetical protein